MWCTRIERDYFADNCVALSRCFISLYVPALAIHSTCTRRSEGSRKLAAQKIKPSDSARRQRIFFVLKPSCVLLRCVFTTQYRLFQAGCRIDWHQASCSVRARLLETRRPSHSTFLKVVPCCFATGQLRTLARSSAARRAPQAAWQT